MVTYSHWPGKLPPLMKPVGSFSPRRCMMRITGVAGLALRDFTVLNSCRLAARMAEVLYALSAFRISSRIIAPWKPSAMCPARKPVIWPPRDTA